MKSGLKKMISVLVMCAMLMGLSMTAFAGPAAPVTSVTIDDKTWSEKDHCYDIYVKVRGFGFENATFNKQRIVSVDSEAWYEWGSSQVAGWIYHFRTPRIYDAGTYKFEATYTSHNGGQQRSCYKTFTVTEDKLQ